MKASQATPSAVLAQSQPLAVDVEYDESDLGLDRFLDVVRERFGSKPVNALRENLEIVNESMSAPFLDLTDQAREVRFDVVFFENLADLIEAYFVKVCDELGCEIRTSSKSNDRKTAKFTINLALSPANSLKLTRSIEDTGLSGKLIRYNFVREAYIPIPEINANIVLRGSSHSWGNLHHLKGYLEGAFLRSGLPEESKDTFEAGVHALISNIRRDNVNAADHSNSLQLAIPENHAPLYQGKKKSGDIVDYLRSEYPPRSGAEILTLQYLREHDPKAYTALYNRQRSEPLPDDVQLPRQSAISDRLLKSYGIDLTTTEGADEARRLAGIIYGRLKFEPKR